MSAGAMTLVRTTSPSRYISIGACVCVCESRKVVTAARAVKAMTNCVFGLSRLSGRATTRAAALRARVKRVVKIGRRRRAFMKNSQLPRVAAVVFGARARFLPVRLSVLLLFACFRLLVPRVCQIAREDFARLLEHG